MDYYSDASIVKNDKKVEAFLNQKRQSLKKELISFLNRNPKSSLGFIRDELGGDINPSTMLNSSPIKVKSGTTGTPNYELFVETGCIVACEPSSRSVFDRGAGSKDYRWSVYKVTGRHKFKKTETLSGYVS